MPDVMFLRKPSFSVLLAALVVLSFAASVPAVAITPSASPPVDGSLAISGPLAGHHTCALAANGTDWCWGYNPTGAIGDGSIRNRRDTPTMPIGVSRAVGVAVGGSHSCALLANGTVQCWGDNSDHQLGNATDYVSTVPVSVVGLDHAVKIDANGEQTCVIRTDATVWCWGSNSGGQLGDGTSLPTMVPVLVSGLTNVVDISVSSAHSCAVRSNGSIWCWGSNNLGQLGDGTTTPRLTPVHVVGISTAKRVAVGNQYSCAALADGTVMCWGTNDHKQLGNDTGGPSSVPLLIAGIGDAVRIAAGLSHVCALIVDGSVLCWGDNGSGQLGIEHGTDHATPISPTDVANVVALSARLDTTCAFLADGSLTCWGPWTLPANDPRFVRGDPGVGNDAFAAAQSITSLPFADGFDASDATLQTNEPDPTCGDPDPGGSVWYRYRSTAARRLTVDSAGPQVAIYKGTSLGTLTAVGCGSSVDLDVEAAESYWLQLFGDLGLTSLSVHATVATPNDDFADAKTIGALPYADTVDTTTATLEPGEPVPTCALNHPPYNSIWYRYISPIDQELRITWSGYQFPRIGVYEPGSGDQLVEVACNGDTNDPSDFFAEAGHEYIFLVRSHGDSGLLTFNLEHVDSSDAVAPSVQVVINPTAPDPGFTNSQDVSFFLSANDPHPSSGLVAMAISGSPDGPWSWEVFSGAFRPWTFHGPDGMKHIFAKVRDAAGNVSSVGDGTVILDRGLPSTNSPQSSVASDETIAALVPLAATVAGTDGLSGISGCQLGLSSNGGSTYSAVACEDGTGLAAVAPGNTQYRFRGRTIDGAGNVSTWVPGPVFKVSMVQESNAAFTRSGTWAAKRDSHASGGRYLQSSTVGSKVKFAYRGKGVGVVVRVGPDGGQAMFTLDGVARLVDLYSPTEGWRRVVFSKSTQAGKHVLTIKVMSSTSSLSTGRRVTVDAAAIVT